MCNSHDYRALMTLSGEEGERPSRVVGRQLKRLRESRGLSAQRLADRCAELGAPEINRSVIANIESRRESVSIDEVSILAQALDVSPVQLFTAVEDEALIRAPAVADRVEKARQRRDYAKRRAAIAEEALLLCREEVDLAQARVGLGGPFGATVAHHLHEAALKEAKERYEAAREELIDARVELAEAREELDEANFAVTPMGLVSRIIAEAVPRKPDGG